MRSGTPAIARDGTPKDEIRVASGSGGGGTGIGSRCDRLYAIRTATPRSTAALIAPPTIAPVSAPRLKSYCARSSVRFALLRKPATLCAISTACWPPSVKVRTVIADVVEELAKAEIGATFNFYRAGPNANLRRRRLREYLGSRESASFLLVGEAPGYRGAGVSGIPLTTVRQLDCSGREDATGKLG